MYVVDTRDVCSYAVCIVMPSDDAKAINVFDFIHLFRELYPPIDTDSSVQMAQKDNNRKIASSYRYIHQPYSPVAEWTTCAKGNKSN